MPRRMTTLAVFFACVVLILAAPARSQQPRSIKFGYAISLTGPGALGAQFTQLSTYKLWIKEVNAAGGIMLSSIGKRVPIEVIEYDDHSNLDDALREIDRLITRDRVDFLLPPWGTEFNVATAPLFYRAGYPDLVVTATSDQLPQLAKRWPNTFWFLGTATGAAESFVDVIVKLHAQGKLGDTVAMVSVSDEFGIGLAKAARTVLKRSGFKIVYDRAYPVETKDMRSMLRDIKQLNPDVFAAFSYPPDTIAITEQARELALNPKIFYTGIGTAFPIYKQRFGDDVQGVMSIGGWDPDVAGARAYLDRHVALIGHEPDRWGSPITYASLQMLQQAIERVGKIDRAAVIKELQTGTFQTIVGPIKLKDNVYPQPWYVGQWQNGEYYGVGPVDKTGARAVIFPKPAWRGPR